MPLPFFFTFTLITLFSQDYADYATRLILLPTKCRAYMPLRYILIRATFIVIDVFMIIFLPSLPPYACCLRYAACYATYQATVATICYESFISPPLLLLTLDDCFFFFFSTRHDYYASYALIIRRR